MKLTFWKENNLDQKFDLSIDEVIEKYKDFLNGRDKDWIEYFGHTTVEIFIADNDGLNSTTDRKTCDLLQRELRQVRHEHYA